MKTAVLIFTSLLAAHPFVVSADSVDGGPIELNAEGLDTVTAGAGPATAAVAAAADALGDFAVTGTSAASYVQNSPVPLQFGTAGAWIEAQRGAASATSYGHGASRSTDIATTANVADNPFGGTIDYTRTVLGTQISVFAHVRPRSHVLDFWRYQIDNMR